MFTNLKEQVYEVKLPTHRQGHKQGEQRLSMLPLQEGHYSYGRQANLNKEVRKGLFVLCVILQTSQTTIHWMSEIS